jgi:hypothetical protein
MIIERRSELTGAYREMEIDVCPQQIKEWEEGKLIQDAMPNLTPSEREFIKTGITDEEWDDATIVIYEVPIDDFD